MNPLDAREADESYEYPARPYTLPMRPAQAFRVLSESGDVPTEQATDWTPEDLAWAERERLIGEITGLPFTPEAWSDKYLTAEDARVLRQDGM